MKARTGLHILKERGVPDGALASFLILVAAITIIPYGEGKQLASYRIPETVSSLTFWAIALAAPVVWVGLLCPIFGLDGIRWKRWAYLTGIGECAVFVLTLSVSTKIESTTLKADLMPGSTSTGLVVRLPLPTRFEATVISVTPSNGVVISTPKEVSINICSKHETDKDDCLREQEGSGGSFIRYLRSGKATVDVFNFEVNPPVHVEIEVKYLRPRLPWLNVNHS